MKRTRQRVIPHGVLDRENRSERGKALIWDNHNAGHVGQG